MKKRRGEGFWFWEGSYPLPSPNLKVVWGLGWRGGGRTPPPPSPPSQTSNLFGVWGLGLSPLPPPTLSLPPHPGSDFSIFLFLFSDFFFFFFFFIFSFFVFLSFLVFLFFSFFGFEFGAGSTWTWSSGHIPSVKTLTIGSFSMSPWICPLPQENSAVRLPEAEATTNSSVWLVGPFRRFWSLSHLWHFSLTRPRCLLEPTVGQLSHVQLLAIKGLFPILAARHAGWTTYRSWRSLRRVIRVN